MGDYLLNNSSLTEWLILIPVIMASFGVREFARAVTAYFLGDDTGRRAGRLTLNPIPHIDWIGFIMILAVGFGWTNPVPINTRNFKDPKKGLALTSLAGPAANIMLAFLSALLLVLVESAHNPGTAVYNVITITLTKFFIYNCSLAIFNLLPIPPLDGAKVVSAILPDDIYFWLMRIEPYGIVIMIILLSTGIASRLLMNGVENLAAFIFYLIKLIGFSF